MSTRKKSTKASEHTAPEPFDLSQLRAPRRYVWREIEREEDDPIRVKLLRLDMREAESIPYSKETPIKELHAAIAPFVAEWNFTAENQHTGEMIDVPPPAEIGGEVFELLDSSIGVEIATWLKLPNVMAQASEKKASTPSVTTDTPPNDDA